ncbi:guanine nucleotide-binding protein subunit alpha [Allomyces javanicus]|nr:guanine nucleotide-binding protein subunit alpha [Allomyces javanicus]
MSLDVGGSGGGIDPTTLSKDEQRKRSARIDKMLAAEAKARHTKDWRRILLLGTSESGKSTVLKQMKLIHNGHLSDYDQEQWRVVLQSNVLQGTCELLAIAAAQHVVWPDDVLPHADLIESLTPTEYLKPPRPLPNDWVTAVKTVWQDPAFLAVYEARQKHPVLDSLDYISVHLDRLLEPQFKVTNDDILRGRQETKSVSETQLVMGGLPYKVYDVPGSKKDRGTWIPFFDDANVSVPSSSPAASACSILFVVATTSYDQPLRDDPRINRMQEALAVFENIVNNKLLAHTAVILFLNKVDMLPDKLRRSPLTATFPDFATEATAAGLDVATAQQSPDAVLKYIGKTFYYLNKAKDRKLYVHHTCATDTRQVKVVLATVNKIILKLNLQMID